MTAAVRLPLVQRTDAWREARRSLITGTAIPVLLGISPWRCEADLADEMLGTGGGQPETVRMRVGSALEPLALELYEEQTGRRVRRSHAMVRHPSLEWAAASLDATVVGEHRAVEVKHTSSRTRFADGVPDDVRAQVAWQLGCLGWPVADVAVLTDDGLAVHEVAADPGLFADLVTVAEDFRRRLAAGGPFARDAARIRRDHPADDGTECEPSPEVADAVRALLDVRGQIARLEESEGRLKAVVEAWMGDHARMSGPGWSVTWRRGKDRAETDWKALSAELIETLPETDRAAVVGRFVTVRPGMRPLRVVASESD